MLRFRGLHIMAGIGAMGVAALLGMLMELSNTAIFTSSCVVYVAVSMWTESRIARRRSQLQGPPPAESAVPHPTPETGARQLSAQEQNPHESRQQRRRETRGGNAA
ncbi:hypothetical protein [Arthrobacter sp. D1-17]